MPFDPERLAATPPPSSGGFDPSRLASTPPPPGGLWQALKGSAKSALNIMSGDSSPDMTPQERQAAEIINGSMAGRIGQAGEAVNVQAQKAAGTIAEAGGKYAATHPQTGPAVQAASIGAGLALGTGAEATLPKGPLSTIALAAGMEGERNPLKSKPETPAYNVPTKTQRALGEIAGTQSGVNPKHLSAVIANPEIMSDATPSMREVGKEYQAVFKELGQQFDTKTYQEVTGMRYAPNDTQTSKLSGIIEDVATRLEADPASVSPADAFLARSAGKKALDGPLGPMAKRQIAADIAILDTYLENNGIPQIKALGQKYFRAAAKESLENIVPRNKQGNAAVVRSLIMAHYGKEAVAALAEGKPIKAAIAAGSGAIMSPWVQGKAIPFVAGGVGPSVGLAGALTAPRTPAALAALRAQRGK